jgi:molybdenum cofactor guanylyltransferase
MLEFCCWSCSCLDKSAIILAGGSSHGFDSDKGLLELNGKPLINHVIDAVKDIVDEIVVVTDSQERADAYAKVVSSQVNFVIDAFESEGPLVGALTGLEAAGGEYSAILPFDSPFIVPEVLTLLFDCCVGRAADVPRSPDMECKPLHSVYHTKQALQAAKEAVAENELEVQAIVERLRGVRYMSTMVIEQLDPDLKTFFTVNTLLDLRKAAVMDKPRKTSKTKPQYNRKR